MAGGALDRAGLFLGFLHRPVTADTAVRGPDRMKSGIKRFIPGFNLEIGMAALVRALANGRTTGLEFMMTLVAFHNADMLAVGKQHRVLKRFNVLGNGKQDFTGEFHGPDGMGNGERQNRKSQ